MNNLDGTLKVAMNLLRKYFQDIFNISKADIMPNVYFTIKKVNEDFICKHIKYENIHQ